VWLPVVDSVWIWTGLVVSYVISVVDKTHILFALVCWFTICYILVSGCSGFDINFFIRIWIMLSSPQILLLHVNWQVSYTCFVCMHVAVHAVVILVEYQFVRNKKSCCEWWWCVAAAAAFRWCILTLTKHLHLDRIIWLTVVEVVLVVTVVVLWWHFKMLFCFLMQYFVFLCVCFYLRTILFVQLKKIYTIRDAILTCARKPT